MEYALIFTFQSEITSRKPEKKESKMFYLPIMGTESHSDIRKVQNKHSQCFKINIMNI